MVAVIYQHYEDPEFDDIELVQSFDVTEFIQKEFGEIVALESMLRKLQKVRPEGRKLRENILETLVETKAAMLEKYDIEDVELREVSVKKAHGTKDAEIIRLFLKKLYADVMLFVTLAINKKRIRDLSKSDAKVANQFTNQMLKFHSRLSKLEAKVFKP